MKIGYKILVCFLLVIEIISLLFIKLQQNCINTWKKTAEKNQGLFMLMNQWARIKQEGNGLEAYFIKNNYKRIAVYGMSYVGVRFVKELKDSEVEIVYGIDKNADNIHSEIKMVTMDDELLSVDAVIVTLLAEFDEVCSLLEKKVNCPIIAIEDIVNEI